MVQKLRTIKWVVTKHTVNYGISTTVPSTSEFTGFLNHQEYDMSFFDSNDPSPQIAPCICVALLVVRPLVQFCREEGIRVIAVSWCGELGEEQMKTKRNHQVVAP